MRNISYLFTQIKRIDEPQHKGLPPMFFGLLLTG
jgi:hypothetical protein